MTVRLRILLLFNAIASRTQTHNISGIQSNHFAAAVATDVTYALLYYLLFSPLTSIRLLFHCSIDVLFGNGGGSVHGRGEKKKIKIRAPLGREARYFGIHFLSAAALPQ